VLDVFLPTGYPQSVTEDYIQYQIYVSGIILFFSPCWEMWVSDDVCLGLASGVFVCDCGDACFESGVGRCVLYFFFFNYFVMFSYRMHDLWLVWVWYSSEKKKTAKSRLQKCSSHVLEHRGTRISVFICILS
jgi:hypothetical protein